MKAKSLGRPRRGREKRETVSLRLTPSQIEHIRKLGGGNFTSGVEYLLHLHLFESLPTVG